VAKVGEEDKKDGKVSKDSKVRKEVFERLGLRSIII
jgi:hypothetical protein